MSGSRKDGSAMTAVLPQGFRFFLFLIFWLWVFVICPAVTGATPAQPAVDSEKEVVLTPRKTLVIGRVAPSPKRVYKRLKGIVDFVAGRLKDLGITGGAVLLARDNEQMVRYLKEGKVDWVTETVFSALKFREESGAEILLKRWKKGVPEYHTVFFVRKDSGINSLRDLKGKKIVFEDPGSTTSYFLPSAALLESGLDLSPLSSIKDPAPFDRVGYAFSGGEEINVSFWVYKGLADAGAFSNLDWDSPEYTPPKVKENLNVIYKTDPVPRALELVRKDLDPRIKQRIKEILLQAHNDPEGKAALEAYAQTSQFTELTDGERRFLENLEPVLELISGQ